MRVFSVRSSFPRSGALVGLLVCAACTAPDPMAPSEWLSLSSAVYQPREAAAGGYQDALGASLAGGLDLNGDRVAVSWEIEGAWSQHDLVIGAQELNNDYDILRLSTGLRVHSRLERVPLGAFARGGLEWRDESSDSDSAIGSDQLGSYVGVGLEWWYSPFAALGPTLSWAFDEHGDRIETRIGLGVRIY